MAALLKRGLEQDRYAVDVAFTGTDGLWQATEFGYDAVLLDLMLPGLDSRAGETTTTHEVKAQSPAMPSAAICTAHFCRRTQR